MPVQGLLADSVVGARSGRHPGGREARPSCGAAAGDDRTQFDAAFRRGPGLSGASVSETGASRVRTVAEQRTSGVQEVKFLLEPGQVGSVLAWMRANLAPDPHGSGLESDGYRVESVYFDTASFDVYHRRGSFGRAKFRIRRYGESDDVFLERKLKRGGVVRKRRLAVEPDAVARLEIPVNGHRWEGSWFQRRTSLRSLRPMVMMNYFRIARLGTGEEGRYRVTLDRDLRAIPAEGIRVPGRIEGPDLLGSRAVLEVKFARTMPAAFRRLVQDQALVETGFSKFRLGLRSCGLVVEPEPEPAAPAPVPTPVPVSVAVAKDAGPGSLAAAVDS